MDPNELAQTLETPRRRLSKVDMHMPLSSLATLRPIKADPRPEPTRRVTERRLSGGCVLYTLPQPATDASR